MFQNTSSNTSIGLRSRKSYHDESNQSTTSSLSKTKRRRRRASEVAKVISLFLSSLAFFIITYAWLKHVLTLKNSYPRPVMTIYMENPSTLILTSKPLLPRITNQNQLKQKSFPHVQQCSSLFETMPIDEFPEEDPFLPWIHDVFPTSDGKYIRFVAQNRRRCNTGKGMEDKMKFWEPQMALFQSIPIIKEGNRIRLASEMENATVKETRFICRFHSLFDDAIYETFSEFPFNYEYVSWRKGKEQMYTPEGKDNIQFWLSQLLFYCPIPTELQFIITNQNHVDQNDLSNVFIDIIPIRTPPRFTDFLFTKDHVGEDLISTIPVFDLKAEFGDQHYLPMAKDSGRWANIPICRPPPTVNNRLVACTWTASAYTRRGDVVGISDTEARVREWILFHKMVGFDHLYLYDNTAPGISSSLPSIAQEFPGFVSYHRWPCSICNNNRPSHKNPGERSSQYAAEASCRERYGPSANWMAFIDTDEYLIPMMHDTWLPLLDKFDKEGIHILKMRSSRAKPRVEHML
jgi:hypothetical protein